MQESGFAEKTVESWEELRGYEKYRWAFRGQKDAKWELRTSFERLLGALPTSAKSQSNYARRLEQSLLREFQRRFHHYDVRTPNWEDELEWLALMQHYGAPTRLLDWTFSVHIAAYFALEQADGDCAVWGINTVWAIEESARIAGPPHCDFFKGSIQWRHDKEFRDAFFTETPRKFVWPANPFRMNERLTIQRGVFTCPGDISVGFEDNLRSMAQWDSDENLVKIIIPRKLREKALKELFSMNVTRATLFPGMDGFAQSLRVYHFVFDHPIEVLEPVAREVR